MDHRYNNGPVRDRSRGSRERDPAGMGMESNYGRLNALEHGDGGMYGARGGGMGRGRSPGKLASRERSNISSTRQKHLHEVTLSTKLIPLS